MPKPDRVLVERALEQFKSAEDVAYFFDTISSPDWIGPLIEVGMFSNPPGPILTGNGVQYPFWPVSRYLVRMAAKDSAAVSKAIRSIPATENPRVHYDLLEALTAMDPSNAHEFVPAASGWLDDPYPLLLGSKLGSLLVRCADGGFSDDALLIAFNLFRLHPNRSQDDLDLGFPVDFEPRMERFEYERTIDECLAPLVDAAGLPALELLSGLVADACAEAAGDAGQSGDASPYWIADLEPGVESMASNPANELVGAVRDAALRLIASDSNSLENVLATLLSSGWGILTRVALFAASRADSIEGGETLTRLVTDAEVLFNPGLQVEYWHLLHLTYPTLTSLQQKAILEAIHQTPDYFSDNDRVPEEIRDELRRNWQIAELAAIAEYLDDSEATWYRELLPEARALQPPSASPRFTDLEFRGNKSPLSAEQFDRMSPDDVRTFLATWKAGETWDAPSPAGLGQVVRAAVANDPARFAYLCDPPLISEPTYADAILWGFWDAARSGREIPWLEAFRLAGAVATAESLEERAAIAGVERDPDWSWSRSTAASLLQEAFVERDNTPPLSLRSTAWEAITKLLANPRDSLSVAGLERDPTMIGLNSTRGRALEAAIRYALWVVRCLDGGSTAPPLDVAPEVRGTLDELAGDPSAEIRSILGLRLRTLFWLDREWVLGRSAEIFPDVDHEVFELAWSSYVLHSMPTDQMIRDLRTEYEVALGRILEEPSDGGRGDRPEVHTVWHLMIGYLRGVLPMEDPLLQPFWADAPTKLKAEALKFIGRSFGVLAGERFVAPVPLPPNEFIARAVELWSARLAYMSNEERREFGWWFTSPLFDPEWSLPQLEDAISTAGEINLDHQVVRRLVDVYVGHESQVLRILRKMIESSEAWWLITSWEGPVMDILRSGASSTDSMAREEAVATIHALGARGYRQFRGLLT